MAGQIIGVEGYLANIAAGSIAGMNAARYYNGYQLLILLETTLTVALCKYISTPNPDSFQTIKANFGLLPPLEEKINKKTEQFRIYAKRSLMDLFNYLQANNEIL